MHSNKRLPLKIHEFGKKFMDMKNSQFFCQLGKKERETNKKNCERGKENYKRKKKKEKRENKKT